MDEAENKRVRALRTEEIGRALHVLMWYFYLESIENNFKGLK